MQIKAYQKKIYALVMCFLFVWALIACSNSNDEDPNNENQQKEENNDSINENTVYDENNEESNDHDSSDNQLEITDDQEQEHEGHVEHEPDEQHVENVSSDADNTPDNSNIASGVNTSDDSNPLAPPPQEPSDQPSEEPATEPDENASDERPTLRTLVKSDDDPRTLTIGMYYMGSSSRDEVGFREIYTRTLEWQHPNVEIEFTSVVDEQFPTRERFSIDVTAELRKLITGDNSPDVLFLSYNDYLRLMEEDLFVALNPFIVESGMSLDDFEPIVTDGLINPQDGQTYGLTPYFNASALIYNKDLFDEMNVPYPRDHMTWEEVFTLAKQMTIRSEDRNVYGLTFDLNNHRVPSLFDVWKSYAHALEVEFYDKETEKPLVYNDEWANIFISVKDLYDAGVFPTESEGAEMQRSNPFYFNTIAMAIVPYGELRRIIDDTLLGQQSVPNWDVVTIPVDPNQPHIGAGVIMEPVLVINANGKNQLDAWRLIESLHSEEWARVNEERLIPNLSSRKDHAVNLAEVDYNKAAFYQLRPSKNHPRLNSHLGIIDSYFRFLASGEFAFSKFLAGEMDIQEALEEFEYWVNYQLEKSKKLE